MWTHRKMTSHGLAISESAANMVVDSAASMGERSEGGCCSGGRRVAARAVERPLHGIAPRGKATTPVVDAVQTMASQCTQAAAPAAVPTVVLGDDQGRVQGLDAHVTLGTPRAPMTTMVSQVTLMIWRMSCLPRTFTTVRQLGTGA